MFIAFVISIIVLIPLGLFAQIDEELSAIAVEWIERGKSYSEYDNEAFVYLSGIMAHPEDEVTAVGVKWLDSYRVAEKNVGLYSGSVQFDRYPEAKHLPVPNVQAKLYCKLVVPNCFSSLINNSPEIKLELAEHAIILSRYTKFLSFKNYQTLIPPRVYSENLKFNYLVAGNKLLKMKILLDAESGNLNVALNNLLKDLTELRTQLALSDHLIHKMVVLSLLIDDLDLLNELYIRYPMSGLVHLEALTSSELSFESPIVYEFEGGRDILTKLDGNPEIIEKGGDLPEWIVGLIFKPNKTINQQVIRYKSLANLSILNPSDFAEAVDIYKLNSKGNAGSAVDYFNYFGSTIDSMGIPDYEKYIARTFDANAKISLINQIIEGKSRGFINPYYPDSNNQYIKRDNRVCLMGPLEDEKGHRCALLYKNAISLTK